MNELNINETPKYIDINSILPSKESHAGLELIKCWKERYFHYVATPNRLNTTYESRKNRKQIHYKENTCTRYKNGNKVYEIINFINSRKRNAFTEHNVATKM